MIFIANKYTHIYYKIIEKAKVRRVINEYSEVHHIIPKSLGGCNEQSNLVRLTYKEHRVCHKLLVKMTTGKDRSKMAFATLYFKIDSTTKKNISKYLSEYRRGGTPITNGSKDSYLFKDQEMPEGWYIGFSPETVKKHGTGNKGKKWITDGNISYQIKENKLPAGFYWGQADYQKQKNSRPGDQNPMFGLFFITNGTENAVCDNIDNIPDGWYNGKVEKHSILKSVSKLGEKNPMFGKIPKNAKRLIINGIGYASMKEAREKTGLSRTKIEKLYKGR